jgi:phosphatidate cytidylyltransferase
MTRVLSGIVMAAVALAAILFLPSAGIRILVSVIAALAAHEYFKIIGAGSGGIFGVAFFAWVVSGSGGSTQMLALIPVAAIILAGAMSLSRNGTGHLAVLSVFSLVYISIPLGLLGALHAEYGWRATVLLIATVAVSDSLQFYSGRLFGRRPLAPAISPKKTIEGAVGGILAGTLFMVVAGPVVLPSFSSVQLAMLGFVMVLLGIVGDLFESRLKREANVKDSSSLIPGHGGVLDRIDALLFVTPAFAIAVGVVR